MHVKVVHLTTGVVWLTLSRVVILWHRSCPSQLTIIILWYTQ